MMLSMTKTLNAVLILFSFFIITTDAKVFVITNFHSQKCLFVKYGTSLGIGANCKKTWKWTGSGQLSTNYHQKELCIQVIKNEPSVGNCASNRSVRWLCEHNHLRSVHGYLSLNVLNASLEITKNAQNPGGQWVIYKSDNSICEYSSRADSSTTSTPFTQPTGFNNEHNSGQLWPRGAYTLLKPNSGCPTSNEFTWKEGWVFQDLDDVGTINTESSLSLHIAGHIDEYGNVKRWFCSKNKMTGNEKARPLWPKGTYCIYMAQSSGSTICPQTESGAAFHTGFASWDNNLNVLNNSGKKGIVPKGTYTAGSSTNMYFCCQSDGEPNIPITLPNEQPFYLLAYLSTTCQKVRWTTVTVEFIVYDTKDSGYNSDLSWNVYPFDFKRKDPIVYYCYYEGCNHTINVSETEEEINFPRSSDMDITSQSCAWIFNRSDEYTGISFNIIHMDIPSNKGCSTGHLEILQYKNKELERRRTFCVTQKYPLPITTSSTSVVLVIKLGTNITNTTGFRLRYKAMTNEGKETSATVETINSGTEPSSASNPPAVGNVNKDKSEFPLVHVVVPLVVSFAVLSAIVVVYCLKRRRKILCGNGMTFQNDHTLRQNDPCGNRDDSFATHYESVDMNAVEQNTGKQAGNKKKKPSHTNPLYEPSDQVQYLSSVNVLYGSRIDST